MTEAEKVEIDKNVKKSQKAFASGFAKGMSVSLAAYSLFALTTSAAAYASDSCPPTGGAGAAAPNNGTAFQPLFESAFLFR